MRRGSGSEVRFALHVRNDNREGTPPLVRLKAHCGPGDSGEPVVPGMLPQEDRCLRTREMVSWQAGLRFAVSGQDTAPLEVRGGRQNLSQGRECSAGVPV